MTLSSTNLADELNINAVIAGDARLSPSDAKRLYDKATMEQLGRWASAMCNRIHGQEYRTYVIDRNINYTNVCSARCTFCAFRRDGDEEDSYTLSKVELHDKVKELVEIGGTQILLQGGMHPDLGLDFYEDMLRGLKKEFPKVHLHAFSPPEFVELVAVCDVEGFPTPGPGKSDQLDEDIWKNKLELITKRLIDAGLDSIPGGGAEIFPEHVRRRIGLGKATAKQWLDVMSTGHKLGLNTSSTMMFGHIEGIADRIEHMNMIRQRQDDALTNNWPGKYLSFIAWPFQRENTPMGKLPDWDFENKEDIFPGDLLAGKVASGEVDGNDKKRCSGAVPEAGKKVRMAGASDYLRTQAVARLFMDNIHSIGSSWVTMGPNIGELALFYGANDMGSVMMEENVVSAAGTTYCLSEPYLCHLIRDAGYIPAQRDNSYNIIKTHEDNSAPDLQVTDWSKHRADKLHTQAA